MKKGSIFWIIGGLAVGTVGAIFIIKKIRDKRREEADKQITQISGTEGEAKLSFEQTVKSIRSTTTGFMPPGYTKEDLAKDVYKIHTAMFWFGIPRSNTDENTIKSTLRNKSRWQLKWIFDYYAVKHKIDLEDDLQDELDTGELREVTNILQTAQSGKNFTGFQLYSTIFTK